MQRLSDHLRMAGSVNWLIQIMPVSKFHKTFTVNNENKK